jgi:hypothetical protein
MPEYLRRRVTVPPENCPPNVSDYSYEYDESKNFDSVVIKVKIETSPQRRFWRRTIAALGLKATPVDDYGSFQVWGLRHILSELVRHDIVLSWHSCAATIPYRAIGMGNCVQRKPKQIRDQDSPSSVPQIEHTYQNIPKAPPGCGVSPPEVVAPAGLRVIIDRMPGSRSRLIVKDKENRIVGTYKNRTELLKATGINLKKAAR